MLPFSVYVLFLAAFVENMNIINQFLTEFVAFSIVVVRNANVYIISIDHPNI